MFSTATRITTAFQRGAVYALRWSVEFATREIAPIITAYLVMTAILAWYLISRI